MEATHTRIHNALALFTVILVVALDQWTKALVVANLGPPDSGHPVPLIGNYLTLYYTRNNGAAFGLFSNSLVLIVLIMAMVGVISYFYLHILRTGGPAIRNIFGMHIQNTGTLAIKLMCGLIIGGGLGNLIDRVRHSGYVVDFIFFQIPQIGFRFAIFNLADASIEIGGILLFVVVLLGVRRRKAETASNTNTLKSTRNDAVEGQSRQSEQLGQITPSATNSTSRTQRSTEQDA